MFRIKASNFLTFKDVEFDFANKGLVLIEGQNKDEALFKSNGSGKTNLVDALCWGLYGKSLKGKSPDKVVNLAEGKNCSVEVWWGDYHVIRYRKHIKFKNDVQFYKANEDQTAKSNRNTQELIDEAIGLSYESFVNSVYFQQNTVSGFANAKDSEQKAIIENLLNLGVLSVAQEICKETVKDYNIALADVQNKYNITLIKKNELDSRIQQLETKALQFDKQKELDCIALQSHINGLQTKKLEQGESVDIEALQELVDKVVSVRGDIKDLEHRLLAINADRRTIQDIQQQYLVKQNTAKNSVDRLLNDLSIKSKLDPKKCPSCGQPTNADVLTQQIELLNRQITDAQNYYDSIPAPSISTDELETEYSYVQKQITSKRELLEMAEQVNRQIMAEQYRRKEVANLDARIVDAESQLNAAMMRTNHFTEQSTEEQDKLVYLQEQAEQLIFQMNTIKSDCSYFDYWVDGLANSKLKSYIMDSITPVLNERANYYSQFLTGGAFQIEISTVTKLKSGELRDKFSVNIHSSSKADYDLSSGGERKRIDIAILLALQDIVASRAKYPLQLLIMDEISENLDEVGVERMLELLRNVSNSKGSCFYITHDENMKPLFPNIVTVTKQHGVSTIA
jgi:DNA repair exonuclease SbcCD ATPase subunit